MITSHDWDAALDAWIIEERERLGGPPSPEEVDAFLTGELNDQEAARVRALLVYYPELTSLLDDVVPPARRSRVRAWAIAAALGAALTIPLAIEIRERNEPTVVLENMQPRGRPSTPVHELPTGKEPYSLELSITEERFEQYRVEVVDTARSKVVWRQAGLRVPLRISVPRRALHAGTYRIDVFGSDEEKVDSFWIRTR